MDEQFRAFIRVYFSPELAGDREELSENLNNYPAEYRKKIKGGLEDILYGESISLLKFCQLTDGDYMTEDEAYLDIKGSYEKMFGKLPEGSRPEDHHEN